METEYKKLEWMEIQQQKYKEQLDKKLDVRLFWKCSNFFLG